GAQELGPGPVASKPRLEDLAGQLRPLPVAERPGRAGDPDLTHFPGAGLPPAALSGYDADIDSADRRPAAREGHGVVVSRATADDSQVVALEQPLADPNVRPSSGGGAQRVFGEAVGSHESVGGQTGSREAGQEA